MQRPSTAQSGKSKVTLRFVEGKWTQAQGGGYVDDSTEAETETETETDDGTVTTTDDEDGHGTSVEGDGESSDEDLDEDLDSEVGSVSVGYRVTLA